MAILITRNISEVNEELRSELKDIPVTYLSLKRIEPITLKVATEKLIRSTDYLVLTSLEAAKIMINEDLIEDFNKELFVLSNHIARLCEANGFKNIIVAQSENRKSVLESVKIINQQSVHGVFLKGNLAPMIEQEGLMNIDIYRNTWSKKDQDRANESLKYPGYTQVLITSSSAVKRFAQLEKRNVSKFVGADFFSLGDATYRQIKQFGFNAIPPVKCVPVLKETLKQMNNLRKERD
ncbi:uroporphyrinogen-III synthase [Pediococcus claussenii]|nr:uroporphyrinogen-III synthase [Pediococcus claussenii]ANZ69152.1 hypothetical protein AYR57_02015 [Pediococcus claussenii]ANZ70969.1 hypothetical protein AYR58_02015 [Pediococcus claussenii]